MPVAALALACLGLTGCQTAPLTHGELIRDHLARLIGAQPAPCGDVKSYARHERLQYRVECQSGDVYGVGVGPDGHVSVEPLNGSAAAAPATRCPQSSLCMGYMASSPRPSVRTTR
jgi:hypothetical protein